MIRFRIIQLGWWVKPLGVSRMSPGMSDCRDSGYSLIGWKPRQSKRWKGESQPSVCIACLCFHTCHDVNNFCHRLGHCGGLPNQLESSNTELNSLKLSVQRPGSFFILSLSGLLVTGLLLGQEELANTPGQFLLKYFVFCF